MARIKGSNKTEVIRPKVRLVSSTSYPIGTLVALWIGSRYEHPVSAKDVEALYNNPHLIRISPKYMKLAEYLCECYPEYAGRTERGEGTDFVNVIENVARMVIKANLPPTESVLFTFEIENANVAWREQLVRGRNQQFWTQTSRTADLTTMDVNRSENIEKYGGKQAVDIYDNAIDTLREAYQQLTDLGVPTEDIRLIPQGMTHRVYWMISLRTLFTIIPKRISWIAQASLWSPIVEDILEILSKLSPLLSNMFGTPLDIKVNSGVIVSHSYDNENEDRYYGRDSQPCDPLWLAYKGYTMPKHTNTKFYDIMKSSYIKLWGQEICDLLGWDKNDPSKLGPYDRPDWRE